jgi:hypothetical protein
VDTRQFFLLRHATLHGPMTADRLGQLTEEQLRTRPHPAVNSVAWVLWHVARCEDFGINRMVGDRSQVLDDEEWMPRLGVYRRDVGRGMTVGEVDELGAALNLDSLRSYWEAVGRRTTAVVASCSPDDLDKVIDATHRRQVVFDEGFVQRDQREEVVGILTGWTRGYALNYLGLTHSWEHVGEIGVLCGLWRYRGRY